MLFCSAVVKSYKRAVFLFAAPSFLSATNSATAAAAGSAFGQRKEKRRHRSQQQSKRRQTEGKPLVCRQSVGRRAQRYCHRYVEKKYCQGSGDLVCAGSNAQRDGNN